MFVKLSQVNKRNARYTRKGFYYPKSWFQHNFHLLLDCLCTYKIDEYGFETEIYDEKGQELDWYGVADNEEQVLNYYKSLLDSDRKFVVALSPVYKTNQPKYGGWRWHKWGDYIGTKKPTREYLYDEPNIDLVYCFHIYEILN